MNPTTPHGVMGRSLSYSAGNVNMERQTARARRNCLLLSCVRRSPVGSAFRPIAPGGRARAVLRVALCLCLCAGMLSLTPSFFGKNILVGRAMAANVPERETVGTSSSATGAQQPATGSAAGAEARSSRAPANDPLGSRELTRELYRLLSPEQTPARVPDGPASPPPASGRPSASGMPATLPAPDKGQILPPTPDKERTAPLPDTKGEDSSEKLPAREASAPEVPATGPPAEPTVTRPAAPATPAPAAPSASQPKAPETPRPKAPATLPPKTPTAPQPKAPVAAPPKAPTVPSPSEPRERALGAVPPAQEEGAPEKNFRPAGDASAGPTPAEASRKAGAPAPRDKGTAPLPEKGATMEAKPAGRELPAESSPAGSGEKAKPSDMGSAAGKGGEPAEAVARQNIVRAEIKSVNLTVLSAPYDGLVFAVLARDGDNVDKGQAVVRLDTRAEEQDLAVAQTLAADVFNRLGALPEGPSRARDELAAEYLRYSAEVRGHENRLAQGVINAPFAGTVTEVHAKAGEHVKQGSPVMEIAESGNLEIVCAVPSAWVRWLRPGHIVWVYVDETAKSYEAVLDRLGGKVDPASKTIRVYARFSSPQAELLPGMSGSASIRPQLAEEKAGTKEPPERGPGRSGQGKSN